MLPCLFNILHLQLDLAATGGDSGVTIAVQVEQLGHIVIPVADYLMLGLNLLLEESKDAGALPSHPPKLLASDRWKLLPLTENPLLA